MRRERQDKCRLEAHDNRNAIRLEGISEKKSPLSKNVCISQLLDWTADREAQLFIQLDSWRVTAKITNLVKDELVAVKLSAEKVDWGREGGRCISGCCTAALVIVASLSRSTSAISTWIYLSFFQAGRNDWRRSLDNPELGHGGSPVHG